MPDQETLIKLHTDLVQIDDRLRDIKSEYENEKEELEPDEDDDLDEGEKADIESQIVDIQEKIDLVDECRNSLDTISDNINDLIGSP